MRTVVLGPRPPELEALIARRRALGLDGHDEVWEGEYHMAPFAHPSHGELDQQVGELLGPLARRAGLVPIGSFNLGEPDDFRVPDRGVLRQHHQERSAYVPTAAIVVEIESPSDETWQKLDFYAARGVDEILIVSGQSRQVTWLLLDKVRYAPADGSRLLGPESAELPEKIDWPDPPSDD